MQRLCLFCFVRCRSEERHVQQHDPNADQRKGMGICAADQRKGICKQSADQRKGDAMTPMPIRGKAREEAKRPIESCGKFDGHLTAGRGQWSRSRLMGEMPSRLKLTRLEVE